MELEIAIQFFDGLYKVIDEDLDKESLIKKGAPVNEILKLLPETLREECEKQFLQTVFEAYFNKDKKSIEFYNDMYDTLLNCLKTNPEQYEGYVEKYPVITSFMITAPLFNNYMDMYKDYLAEK